MSAVDLPETLESWRTASPLGPLTLKADATSLRFLDWSEDPPDEGMPDHPVLRQAVIELAAYFEDARMVFETPTAPAGNAFEQAVWRQMTLIPSGETQSYGDLGAAIGKPARAVGGACGANPIPIIIPCHRVIGGNGRMVGYSGKGGVETKQWLLRHEGALLI